MDTINSKYYLLVKDSAYPSLEYRDPDYQLRSVLASYEPIGIPEDSFDLYFRSPVPRNPKLADYHVLLGVRHVVSERVKHAIEEVCSVKIEYLPACIHTKNDYEDGYFILNVYNVIWAMDKERSFWRESFNPSSESKVGSIDKLVLDASKLRDVPLSERLIFALGESTTFTLFHESVIDNIAKLDPKGFYAVPVEAWDNNVSFLL